MTGAYDVEILVAICLLWTLLAAAYLLLRRRQPGYGDIAALKRAKLPSARDRFAMDPRLLRPVRVPHPSA